MTKSGLDAQTWLGLNARSVQSVKGAILPPLPQEISPTQANDHFQAQQFLLPGWKGEGLRSKQLIRIEGLVQEFIEDARSSLGQKHFSRQNKAMLLEDLNSFCMAQEVAIELDAQQMWDALWENDGPWRDLFDRFLKDFVQKSVHLAILKIYCAYFLLPPCSESARSLALHQAHNTLANAFPRLGTWELTLESLRLNQFTWYRPSSQLVRKLIADFPETWELQEIDWTKIFQLDQTNNSPLTWPHRFQFIKTLNIEFPQWVEAGQNKKLRVQSLTFAGDQVEFFFYGHWASLGQPHHEVPRLVHFDFAPSYQGRFLRLVHQLLQISYLSKMARQQGVRPADFISNIFRENEQRLKATAAVQTSLFQVESQLPTGGIELLTINLMDFPKNNPHFHLVSQISRFKEQIVAGGRLIVLSHKKLFVPSQSDKVNGLLQSLKLEATFSLDTLKARGDLAPYIYVFTKRHGHETHLNLNSTYTPSTSKQLTDKQSIMSFRFSGELSHSGALKIFNEQLQLFFKKRSPGTTTLYQMECGHHLNFEFYLDAIVDGKLINSTSKDQSKITHPHFFKGLWKTCLALDDFLQLEHIEAEHQSPRWPAPHDLLGLGLAPQDRFQYILIVDHRLTHRARLEIIPAESYPVIREEYGVSLCSYFGAIPKKSGLNLNLLRAYFDGPIGGQQVAMALTGNTSKLKGRLRSLLIPKFFAEEKEIPKKLAALLIQIPEDKNQIKNLSRSFLTSNLLNILDELQSWVIEYPLAVLTSLCQLQFNINEALTDLKFHSQGESYLFSNPMIIQGMQKLENFPIYPKHPDIFLDFKATGLDSLQLIFSHCEINEKDDHSFELVIQSDLGPILGLHGPRNLLEFCHYVLKAAQGHTCLTILQGLRAPSSQALSTLLTIHDDIGNVVNEMRGNVEATIHRLFRQQLVGKDLA